MDAAHAYTLEGTTELSVAKEEFKFNAAHFVVLEVSATGLFGAPVEVHYSFPLLDHPDGSTSENSCMATITVPLWRFEAKLMQQATSSASPS